MGAVGARSWLDDAVLDRAHFPEPHFSRWSWLTEPLCSCRYPQKVCRRRSRGTERRNDESETVSLYHAPGRRALCVGWSHQHSPCAGMLLCDYRNLRKHYFAIIGLWVVSVELAQGSSRIA